MSFKLSSINLLFLAWIIAFGCIVYVTLQIQLYLATIIALFGLISGGYVLLDQPDEKIEQKIAA